MSGVDAQATAYPEYVAVGAGRMGRGIATAFAYAGRTVSLVDMRPRSDADWQRLQAEVNQEIAGSLAALAELEVMPAQDVAHIAARVRLVRADAAPAALAAASLLFECLPETLDAKAQAFQLINAHCPDDAVLTSTTSSILVTELVPLVRAPGRFFNMHWLNPAYLIPVVELSQHGETQAWALEHARATLQAIGKVPVVCGATPGYIVPRLQALIMNEAARMVEEGVVTAEEIDKATRYGLGLRFSALGVVEFIDYGGADILYHASGQLSRTVDAARYAAPDILQGMMARGALGLKSGSGFYDYTQRNVAQYRQDALARTLQASRALGTFRPPAGAGELGQPEDPTTKRVPSSGT